MSRAEKRLHDQREEYQKRREDVRVNAGNWEEAQRELDDLARWNRQRMEDLMKSTQDPEVLMRIAVSDSILTEHESRKIIKAHNDMSNRANIALQMWLQKHGSPLHLMPGDELLVIEDYQVEREWERETRELDRTSQTLLKNLGAWLLHPRRRQKLTWLAIVTPAVITCLIELL